MPEFTAPASGQRKQYRRPSISSAARTPAACSTPWAAPVAASPCYMDKGHLVLNYNLMIIEQDTARTAEPIPAGKHKIEVITEIAGPGKEGSAVLLVDGKEGGKAERQAHRPRCLLRQRNLRRWRRPRLHGLARLFRPPTFRVQREDREGRRPIEITKTDVSSSSRLIAHRDSQRGAHQIAQRNRGRCCAGDFHPGTPAQPPDQGRPRLEATTCS